MLPVHKFAKTYFTVYNKSEKLISYMCWCSQQEKKEVFSVKDINKGLEKQLITLTGISLRINFAAFNISKETFISNFNCVDASRENGD